MTTGPCKTPTVVAFASPVAVVVHGSVERRSIHRTTSSGRVRTLSGKDTLHADGMRGGHHRKMVDEIRQKSQSTTDLLHIKTQYVY